MASIREIGLKIKALGAAVASEWGVFILVILAVTGAFGLGRLSVLSGQKSPILVQNSAFAASSTGQAGLGAVLGTYVASKEGNIYYFPWCPAAEKIAPTDRVWFADEKAAQKAGYGPDTHCKGMGSQ